MKPQKGVECSVEGCTEWCVCNDLCHRHNMAKSRYGSPEGKPEKVRTCKTRGCKNKFSHKYDRVIKCEECRKAHRKKKMAGYAKKHRKGKK